MFLKIQIKLKRNILFPINKIQLIIIYSMEFLKYEMFLSYFLLFPYLQLYHILQIFKLHLENNHQDINFLDSILIILLNLNNKLFKIFLDLIHTSFYSFHDLFSSLVESNLLIQVMQPYQIKSFMEQSLFLLIHSDIYIFINYVIKQVQSFSLLP